METKYGKDIFVPTIFHRGESHNIPLHIILRFYDGILYAVENTVCIQTYLYRGYNFGNLFPFLFNVRKLLVEILNMNKTKGWVRWGRWSRGGWEDFFTFTSQLKAVLISSSRPSKKYFLRSKMNCSTPPNFLAMALARVEHFPAFLATSWAIFKFNDVNITYVAIYYSYT